jgi:dsDNA-specific endonuclease/ATPase MutS2
VEEYLYEAHRRGYQYVRIIHGKGIGVQREVVRGILERTSFVTSYADAPPTAGGPGATLATLATLEMDRS